MTLSGTLEYLEYWHLFLPGSSWLFVGNYVHFYYSLYQQTSYLWEKVTAFLQYLCFGSHPSSQTFIKCLLYALFQLTVWFSLSNLATHSLLLLHSPPPPPSSPPTANESSILAGHSKPAQQVNQGLDMVRDAGDSGLFQKGPWSFGERENCSLLCIACLCSTPPKSRRLPVESTLQLFRNLCSNPLEGGESAPIKALS